MPKIDVQKCRDEYAELDRLAKEPGADTQDIARRYCVLYAEVSFYLLRVLPLIRFDVEKRTGKKSEALNAFEYIVLFLLDLMILREEMFKNKGKYREHLFGRLLAANAYESTEKLQHLLAKKSRDEMVATIGDPELEPYLRRAHKEACILWEWCRDNFKDVRNSVAVHKDMDPNVRISGLAVDMDKVAAIMAMVMTVVGSLFTPMFAFLKLLPRPTEGDFAD